jgi:hypothetical protein
MMATQIIDKNGMDIKLGDEVSIPFPNKLSNDTWNTEFVGVVIDFDESEDLVSVKDQEGECFYIAPDRIEVV